jgi:hypothetical protein
MQGYLGMSTQKDINLFLNILFVSLIAIIYLMVAVFLSFEAFMASVGVLVGVALPIFINNFYQAKQNQSMREAYLINCYAATNSNITNINKLAELLEIYKNDKINIPHFAPILKFYLDVQNTLSRDAYISFLNSGLFILDIKEFPSTLLFVNESISNLGIFFIDQERRTNGVTESIQMIQVQKDLADELERKLDAMKTKLTSLNKMIVEYQKLWNFNLH